ncbi:MAG: molecular chaperone [Deltaproteobacteria bacterium RBG_16_49_23]|nr:MAG: molecular chaperone [Deltaproteobacteria bacterium RBG_16_49_23]
MAWELTTWKPFRELTPFRDFDRMGMEMDRFWDSFFDIAPKGKTEEGGGWFPYLDVSETKSDIVVKAELPGIDPKDIDISLSDGMLILKGERKSEKEEKDEDYHLVERSYGTFYRSVRLPREVQSNKINASYKDGVLKITLPKTGETKKKEIKIKVE